MNTIGVPHPPAQQPRPTPFPAQNSTFAPAGTVPELGYKLTLVLIFFTFTRMVEFLPHPLAVIHPVILLLFFTGGVALLSGCLGRVVRSPIYRYLLFFTAWTLATAPFSVWRGGTVRMLVNLWMPGLMVGIVTVAYVVSLEQCRKAFHVIALGTLAIVFLSFFLTTTHGTRDVGRLGFASGTLQNSNDLAAVLLMGLPFCLLAASAWSGLRKVAASFASLLAVMVVVRTGSRSGLLALGLLAILLFLRGSIGSKIKLVLVGSVLLCLSLIAAHRQVLDRYKTLFDTDDTPESAAEASAMASSSGRTYLLKRSLWETWHHPLMGVGAGMFTVAESYMLPANAPQISWKETHNMYTQLSSETGIPGLFLYGAAIWLCFRRLRAVQKSLRSHPEWDSIANAVNAVRLSLLMFAFTAFFSSSAYYCYFPILAAFASCLDSAVRNHILVFEQRAAASPATSARAPAAVSARAFAS